jgi:BirA family transcriptional regulator, biotin operon repressor / biotin---[acetyl-CoA-carboxylase] ligase
MDERTLRKAFSSIPLGGLRYFEQTGSTNDIALAWAATGAPDLALVYAEEQTAGRGRGNRRWFTPAEAALAFSLVLRPLPGIEQTISLFSALGALAVCEALAAQGLQPQIKWPNDVLLNRSKVCGVLAESVWLGEKVESVVLGVGLNIKPQAVPPPELLNFPATCLEDELPPPRHQIQPRERAALLGQILQSMLAWRLLVATDIFLQALEGRMAFRGEMVEIWANGQVINSGRLDGLGQDGSLRLLSPLGKVLTVQYGEVHMSPVT